MDDFRIQFIHLFWIKELGQILRPDEAPHGLDQIGVYDKKPAIFDSVRSIEAISLPSLL